MTSTSSCISCGSKQLHEVFSLGLMPLANALLSHDQVGEKEERFPLDVAMCSDCSLVQITEIVPPSVLFEDYLYFSSYSDHILEHTRLLADEMVELRNLSSSSLVIEIASNDGYLLKQYLRHDVPVLGIEPARNIAKIAEAEGVQTIADFFSAGLASDLVARGVAPDVVHANNVLAHVPDPNGFLSGIRSMLKPDGVLLVEVPYLLDLVRKHEFDTIYHEHICYFSLTALDSLFRRNGLTIVDVRQLDIHGGSLRIYAQSEGSPSDAVVAMLEAESREGVANISYFKDFASRVDATCQELLALVNGLKAKGKTIAAYGASAKGAMLLNYTGLGRDTLDFAVDRNEAKQERFIPGALLPVYPVEHMLKAMPDYMLLLAWNHADEILAQQSEYRRQGGQFIRPIPVPTII